MKIALLSIAGTLLAVGLVLFGVFLERRTRDPFNPKQPPNVVSGSSTKDIVEDAGPARRFNLLEGRAPVVRVGRTDPLPIDSPEREQQRRYSADVLRSEAISLPDGLEIAEPLDSTGFVPPIRVVRDNDLGRLMVMDSRGAWRLEETKCPEGRRWEAGTTLDGLGFYGNCERTVPALLPEVGKTVLVCAAAAGAGYLIAEVAEYEHPEYVAGAASAGCVLIRIAG